MKIDIWISKAFVLESQDIEVITFFLSGDNPDLLYQELASDNELEKSVHDGGNSKLVFLRTEIASV